MKHAWLEVEKLLGRPERYCLDGFERIVIGSSPFATLRMPRTHYLQEHAALSLIDGRWQLADLGSNTGVWMNDKRMLTARWLDSGDAFWMRKEQMFRFLEQTVDPRVLEQLSRVAQSDDSDGPWMVLSDALQELGEPYASKMPTAGEDPLLPLGFLETLRSDGAVQLKCHFGFAQRMTVRNLGMARGLQHRVFDAVLSQPVIALLRELVIDIPSFHGVSLESIAGAINRSAPQSLRKVRLSGLVVRPAPQLFREPLKIEWELG
jgi:hypothetical protein